MHISKASLHDVNVLDVVPYQAGGFYVMDKAYIDFARLYAIHLQKAFFVTRAKDKLRFKRMYSRGVDKATGVRYDQLGGLEGHYSKKSYPEKLRRIKYYDGETGKEFVFLTNYTDLEATQIAMLYKKRWEVQLFFK